MNSDKDVLSSGLMIIKKDIESAILLPKSNMKIANAPKKVFNKVLETISMHNNRIKKALDATAALDDLFSNFKYKDDQKSEMIK